MITDSSDVGIIFIEALAKMLIHKGVVAKSELVDQLAGIRDEKGRAPAEQTLVAAEIDMMLTRVDRL